MIIAIISGGKSGAVTWVERRDSYKWDLIIAINAAAHQEWIGPYDVLASLDHTWLQPQPAELPSKYIMCKEHSNQYAMPYALPRVNINGLERHYTATATLNAVAHLYGSIIKGVHLFGFDMKPGAALSDKSSPWESRNTEQQEFDDSIARLRALGADVVRHKDGE